MPDVPLKHGTLNTYNRGCRCDDCRHARRVYIAAWHKRSGRVKNPRGWQGRSIPFDPDRLRRLIECEGRSIGEFCDDIGILQSTLDHLLLRGSATEKTIDLIACGLGCHMSQLESEA